MRVADNFPLMADDHLFRAGVLNKSYERDALLEAKDRQDKSYTDFDRWIAAAIAELTAEQ